MLEKVEGWVPSKICDFSDFSKVQKIGEITKFGQGGPYHELTNNNFAFHEPRNKYLRFHASQK